MAGDLNSWKLLYVSSRITKPDTLHNAAFAKWGDEEQIPGVLSNTHGFTSCIRSVDIDDKAERPFLSMYVGRDITNLMPEELFEAGGNNNPVPGSTTVSDIADLNMRLYSVVEVFDPTQKGKGATKIMMVCQMEPDETLTDEDMDKWYEQEHNYQMTLVPGYLRGTRYKLDRNWSSGNMGDSAPKVPRWLAIHEFDADSVDLVAMFKRNDLPWQREIMKHLKAGLVIHRIAKRHGDESFFHGI